MVIKRIHVVAAAAAVVVALSVGLIAHDVVGLSPWAIRMNAGFAGIVVGVAWAAGEAWKRKK